MDVDVLSRLRDATRDAHERLEGKLDILERMKTSEGRHHLVRGFHGLHAGAEAVLTPWLSDLDGLDFADRRRVDRLADDLKVQGIAAGPPCPVAAPTSASEALGLLYVLEGSSLGAKVIRKQAALRGQDMTGLSFLDPYGERTGDRWRGFLAVLSREAPADDEAAVEAAVRGGVAGFGYAESWLCEPETAQ